MTGTARVPATEITGLYGSLLKLGMRKMVGRVPDSATVMWHHPQVFKDTMGFGRRMEKWDQVDPGLATYAVMATAAHVGCSFCLDLNYFMIHHRGLDERKAREVPRWRESEVFSERERRVLAYAEAVSETPPAATDAMVAELLADLGAPALLELTARIGTMNMMARTNIALGIHSEEFAEACGLEPLAAPADRRSPVAS
jgi:alkylhydroperoxidase family enzyme